MDKERIEEIKKILQKYPMVFDPTRMDYADNNLQGLAQAIYSESLESLLEEADKTGSPWELRFNAGVKDYAMRFRFYDDPKKVVEFDKTPTQAIRKALDKIEEGK